MKGSFYRRNATHTILYYLLRDSCLRVNTLRRNSVDVYCLLASDFRDIYGTKSVQYFKHFVDICTFCDDFFLLLWNIRYIGNMN